MRVVIWPLCRLHMVAIQARAAGTTEWEAPGLRDPDRLHPRPEFGILEEKQVVAQERNVGDHVGSVSQGSPCPHALARKANRKLGSAGKGSYCCDSSFKSVDRKK